MAAVIWDTQEWAKREFGGCKLGDQRRNKRLVKLAVQVAARPDGSTPDQTEKWSDLKAAYRLFDSDDVSFQAIIEPHCQRTREACAPGSVKLIMNDTTELNYTSLKTTSGLGPIGNGTGRGFFLHSALMLDATTGFIDGMAGQEIFYRPQKRPKGAKNSRRRDPNRESAIWGKLIDRVGRPPTPDVRWIHVCDRGADDYEVMLRCIRQGCGFVIRAARLNRKIMTPEGKRISLDKWLKTLTPQGEWEVVVKATSQHPQRTARVTLRYGEILMPQPQVVNSWITEHAPENPLRLSVVELRECSPPKGVKPIRWVLYSTEPVANASQAKRIIYYYEQRPMIEDYHKCFKTGCKAESRQYETADRLERVVGLLSVVAVRLLQMKTAAVETPNRPAEEVAPLAWIKMLAAVRKIPASKLVTIRDFLRQLAGLGGHLLRKHDGEPGWITIWRGYEKLHLMLRGADAVQKRCG